MNSAQNTSGVEKDMSDRTGIFAGDDPFCHRTRLAGRGRKVRGQRSERHCVVHSRQGCLPNARMCS